MPEVSAAAVKALRERTNLPMMKCKEALTKAGGIMVDAGQTVTQNTVLSGSGTLNKV